MLGTFHLNTIKISNGRRYASLYDHQIVGNILECGYYLKPIYIFFEI